MADISNQYDDLEDDMSPDDIRRKKLVAGTQKLVEGSFPSTEELQSAKQERRSYIDKLREKGYPGIANVAEDISDAATPGTREEYMQGLAVPEVGTVGKVGKEAPTFFEAVAKKEAKPGAKSFAEHIRGVSIEPAEEATEAATSRETPDLGKYWEQPKRFTEEDEGGYLAKDRVQEPTWIRKPTYQASKYKSAAERRRK